MKTENTTMYHFRANDPFDQNWVVGNRFSVGNKFRNSLCCDVKPIDKNLSRIEQKIEYYKLLKDCETMFNIRETMLELFRSTKYPDLISRMNCVYFCDEQSILYWANMFPQNYELYKVIISGELFKSCPKFFADIERGATFEKIEKIADGYWNPNFMDAQYNYFAEYLFNNGTIEIVDKLNPQKVRDRYK